MKYKMSKGKQETGRNWLRRMAEFRYGGLQADLDIVSPDGAYLHMWVYPGMDDSEFENAVYGFRTEHDIVQWSWDYIPKEYVREALLGHMLDIISCLVATTDHYRITLMDSKDIALIVRTVRSLNLCDFNWGENLFRSLIVDIHKARTAQREFKASLIDIPKDEQAAQRIIHGDDHVRIRRDDVLKLMCGIADIPT